MSPETCYKGLFCSWTSGGARRQKGRKVTEREQKIKIIADELANEDRDIDSYISAIKHCVVSFHFS